MNKLVKSVSSKTVYHEFLSALNGILGLTNRELALFEMIVEFEMNHTKDPNVTKNIICTANRRVMMKQLNITRDNLCRYISKFKSLGYIVKGKTDGEWVLNRALVPVIINDRVQVTIILKVKDNDEING